MNVCRKVHCKCTFRDHSEITIRTPRETTHSETTQRDHSEHQREHTGENTRENTQENTGKNTHFTCGAHPRPTCDMLSFSGFLSNQIKWQKCYQMKDITGGSRLLVNLEQSVQLLATGYIFQIYTSDTDIRSPLQRKRKLIKMFRWVQCLRALRYLQP